MISILLIDDDQNLVNLLKEYLENQGYTVHSASDEQKGMRAFYNHQPDIIILDITMPGRDGWEILERIREVSDKPVIMLTARSGESEILRGFSLGADDYVSKPFSFAQLSARVGAVLARTGDKDTDRERLEWGGLRVELTICRVYRDGQSISLTPTEFKLLTTLMRRPGEVLSPEDLVCEVWGPQYKEEIGFVRRYIWHLRRKVEVDPEKPQFIHNERGFGYRFGESKLEDQVQDSGN